MMNMRDDIELSVLAETGDVQLAEAVGFAVATSWEMLCAIIGVPVEAIL